MAETTTDLLTSREVAEALNISPISAVRWIKSGKLAGFRMPNGHYRVPRSEVLAVTQGQFLATDAPE